MGKNINIVFFFQFNQLKNPLLSTFYYVLDTMILPYGSQMHDFQL